MLVLFDIDGTLLESPSRIHARAVEHAAAEVYGARICVAEDSPANDGLTTPLLARKYLQEHGAWDPSLLDSWRLSMIRHYRDLQGVMREQRPLEGAQSALDRLVDAGIRVGLLTGNYREVAVAKLRVAGVWHERIELGQGAFGDDSENRNELGRIARRRAERAGALPLVVVGDTPRDVACARAAGALSVVLNTGGYSKAELVGADYVAIRLDQVAEFLVTRPPGLERRLDGERSA